MSYFKRSERVQVICPVCGAAITPHYMHMEGLEVFDDWPCERCLRHFPDDDYRAPAQALICVICLEYCEPPLVLHATDHGGLPLREERWKVTCEPCEEGHPIIMHHSVNPAQLLDPPTFMLGTFGVRNDMDEALNFDRQDEAAWFYAGVGAHRRLMRTYRRSPGCLVGTLVELATEWILMHMW